MKSIKIIGAILVLLSLVGCSKHYHYKKGCCGDYHEHTHYKVCD